MLAAEDTMTVASQLGALRRYIIVSAANHVAVLRHPTSRHKEATEVLQGLDVDGVTVILVCLLPLHILLRHDAPEQLGQGTVLLLEPRRQLDGSCDFM